MLFQKGQIPWNKGLKGWNKEYPKVGFQKGNKLNWKGGVYVNDIKGYMKLYRETHPETTEARKKHIESNRKWRRNNPLRVKLHNHNRRLRIKGLSIYTIQKVYEDNIKKYSTLTCYLCEQPIKFGKDHLEHKTPLSRGGDNSYDNLGVACKECNHSKHIMTENEFRDLKVWAR